MLTSKKPKEEEEDIPEVQDVDLSESDDTDDEEITAKIGRVPWKWYENYKHMGYDADM